MTQYRHIVNSQLDSLTVTREITRFVSIKKKNPEKVIQKCKFFNIAINNIEYTISQLVYIISSVATSVNLFKK